MKSWPNGILAAHGHRPALDRPVVGCELERAIEVRVARRPVNPRRKQSASRADAPPGRAEDPNSAALAPRVELGVGHRRHVVDHPIAQRVVMQRRLDLREVLELVVGRGDRRRPHEPVVLVDPDRGGHIDHAVGLGPRVIAVDQDRIGERNRGLFTGAEARGVNVLVEPIAINSRPCGASSSYSSCQTGRSQRQPHQEDHATYSFFLPEKAALGTGLPSRSGSVNAGAVRARDRGRVIGRGIGEHRDPAVGFVRQGPLHKCREGGEVDLVVDDEPVTRRGAARTLRPGTSPSAGGPSRWLLRTRPAQAAPWWRRRPHRPTSVTRSPSTTETMLMSRHREFRELDRVERGALAKVVAGDPEVERVRAATGLRAAGRRARGRCPRLRAPSGAPSPPSTSVTPGRAASSSAASAREQRASNSTLAAIE